MMNTFNLFIFGLLPDEYIHINQYRAFRNKNIHCAHRHFWDFSQHPTDRLFTTLENLDGTGKSKNSKSFCFSGNDWHAIYRAFCFGLALRYAMEFYQKAGFTRVRRK